MFHSANMTSSETGNQINEARRRPNTAKPGTRVLKAHPLQITQSPRSHARVGGGAKTSAPCQKVLPQIRQQVPRQKRRADGETESGGRPGNVVISLIDLNIRVGRNPDEAHHQAPRRSKVQKSRNGVNNIGNSGIRETVPDINKVHSWIEENSRVPKTHPQDMLNRGKDSIKLSKQDRRGIRKSSSKAEYTYWMQPSTKSDQSRWIGKVLYSTTTRADHTSDVRSLLLSLLRKRGKELKKRRKEQMILFGGLIQNSKNTKNW